jgi:xanthine dehydrogenase FAD-binding subunit
MGQHRGNDNDQRPGAVRSCPAFITHLLALKAKVTCWRPGGKKQHGLGEFFRGPGRTLLGLQEILTEISFEKPHLRSAGAYLKLSRRKGMDLPLLGIAVQIQVDETHSFCEDVGIGLGVAAPTPIRLRRSEEILKGQRITEKILALAADLASQETQPRDSFRCNAEYRREMIKNLLPTVIRTAVSRIGKSMG